jgi:hypothetical protein
MEIFLNNIENKAKFFALYWGQEVLNIPRTGQLWNVFGFEDEEGKSVTGESFLELKPLSAITDEDAVELAKIMGMQEETEYVFIGKILANNVFDNSDEMSETTIYNMHCQAIDYLRLRGYAVQWYDLTVEEQVSRGWVKLVGIPEGLFVEKDNTK